MSVAPPRTQLSRLSLKKSPSTLKNPNLSGFNTQNSSSFINLTSSALAGVFGSSASLSDLAGDNVSFKNANDQSSKIDLNQANLLLSESFNRPSFINTNTAEIPTINIKLSKWSLFLRYSALFVFGIIYGHLVKTLHHHKQVSGPIFDLTQTHIPFFIICGFNSIVISSLLPFFDHLYPNGSYLFSVCLDKFNSSPQNIIVFENRNHSAKKDQHHQQKAGTDWVSILRAYSALIGILYGVRKLSWDSTLQVAFLWACLNPFIWYLLDGTINGLFVSTVTTVFQTLLFAIFLPSHLPSTSSTGYFSVLLWTACVLFNCSLCFGNLGRRLLGKR